MKTMLFWAAVTAGLCLGVEERNTTRRSFAVVPLNTKLIVDTVEGNIRVTGYSGSQVEVTVEERWRADDAEKLQQARRDIRLDMTQEGNTVRLYVDGPFRCRGNCGDSGNRGYGARFDFDVRVPSDAAIELRTVNGGRVEVENVHGDFNVRNVNGSIRMNGLAGSGSAHTVNGGVAATFQRNPQAAVSLKTVNGEIDAGFQPGLSADLRVKTFNGDAWTDFDAAPLPSNSQQAERDGKRFRIRKEREARLRVGSGGPEHSFDTLNGSIQIVSKGR